MKNWKEFLGLNPSMFFKTKMCPHLQDGICSRGPSCNYAHSQNELRSAPNLKKTRLCQQFLSGNAWFLWWILNCFRQVY